MNHRAKFDAASFILGREIHNRTNTHKKQQPITECVDNKAYLIQFHNIERKTYIIPRSRCDLSKGNGMGEKLSRPFHLIKSDKRSSSLLQAGETSCYKAD